MASFRFTPAKSGRYELRMAYSAHATRASNVPLVVQSGKHQTKLSIDQRVDLPSGKLFRPIGTVDLTANMETVITMSNANTDGFVILDAFQLIRQEE